MKNFKKLYIRDARLLIEQTANDEPQFKYRTLKKKSKGYQILAKKSFDKYCDEHDDVHIVGKIRKRQIKYTDYASDDELIREKQKKKITGQVILDVPDSKPKKYDLKKDKHCHTYGYAWVGDYNFVRVVTLNPLFIILPLLIAALIVAGILLCPKAPQSPFVPANGSEITNQDNEPVATEQLPNCDYLLFDETVTLNKNNQSIKLCNLSSNEGLWYISYQVYIDDEPLMDINDPGTIYETGAIEPGFQVDGAHDANLNLYHRLPAGQYKLTAKATQYQYEANENGEHLKTSVGQNITTTLVINK